MGFEPVAYDAEADALYVQLIDQSVGRTHPLDGLRLIDYSQDGGVAGVDFLEASHGVDLRDVPFSKRIDQLIRSQDWASRSLP
jgi:uncharacterized protein YuzE